MTRWIGVVRVSTDDQAGGAETQRGLIEAWVRKRKGDKLVAVHIDEVRGTIDCLSQRMAIAAAWEALATGAADGIVVTRLDRLARDIELQEMLLRECRNRRCVVASCNTEEERLLEGLDEPDPTRKLIRVILGAVAEYERGVIRIRARAGIARAKKEGRYMGGRRPYGQQLDERTGKLVLDADEAKVIGQSLMLRDMGCTLEEVGEFWLQAGMMPRLAKTKRHSSETVRQVLAAAPAKGIRRVPLGPLAIQFAGVRMEIIGARSGPRANGNDAPPERVDADLL